MGNACSPRLGGKDFQLPDLRAKNHYGTTEEIPDDNITRTIFPESCEDHKNSMVVQSVQNSSSNIFEDKHFKMDSKKSMRLPEVFNFQTTRSKVFSKREETDITNFVQLNIEYSYLTSVFYLLCRPRAKSDLLPKIIENQEVNPYGAYSTYLWCNGEQHNVIVDDRMVVYKDSFQYLRMVKGIELWPLILEKAWVKMIGGYEAALGLSPEESFEEITGIPAYTYSIRNSNRETIRSIIHSAKAHKYWVVLIALNGLKDLQNRQCFML